MRISGIEDHLGDDVVTSAEDTVNIGIRKLDLEPVLLTQSPLHLSLLLLVEWLIVYDIWTSYVQ